VNSRIEDGIWNVIGNVPELESWSPVSLEKAVNARFVTGEWDSYYNELIYKD
jgi:hypothetical protein